MINSQLLDDHFAKGEFPGAVVALRLASGSELLLTSGKQNTSDTAAAVDAGIPWGIGSATKTFVAVTILQLSAGVCVDVPFGWESTRFDCLVMYSANESNIAFYESDQTIVAFGLTYEF